MKFIINFVLVALVLGLATSILFALGNSKSKDRIFYLVMTVVTLIGILGTLYFQSFMGIWHLIYTMI